MKKPHPFSSVLFEGNNQNFLSTPDAKIPTTGCRHDFSFHRRNMNNLEVALPIFSLGIGPEGKRKGEEINQTYVKPPLLCQVCYKGPSC